MESKVPQPTRRGRQLFACRAARLSLWASVVAVAALARAAAAQSPSATATGSAAVAESPTDRPAGARAASIDASLMAKLAKKGDLTLRDTPLGEALFTIGDLFQVNLVVNSEVEGKVNGTFKATPLHEILDSILLAHGYSYRPVAQSLVITKLEELGDFNPLLQSATITVRAANPAELVKAAELLRSPRGKIEAIASAKTLVVVDFPDRIASIRELIEQIDAVQVREKTGGTALAGDATEVVHISVHFVQAETLIDSCKAVLSKDGKVAALKRENQIIASDHRDRLALVKNLVKQLDYPRPQVRITSLIYDISLEDLEKLGFNWNSKIKGRQDRNGVDRTTLALDSVTRVPFSGTPIDGAMTFANLGRNVDLGAVVSAIRELNNSRLLADPSVTVLNNEEALIQIIQEVPYQELTQTSGGGNIGTTAFKEVGVKLQVTPQIADDETIQMSVHPTFSRLAGFTPNTDQPIIDRREANTFVRVTNGQTLVIGGLRQRSDNTGFRGVPNLRDRKFIGGLFRGRSTAVRESELVVFLTPELVPAPNCLRDADALETGRGLLDGIPHAPALPFCRHDPAKRCERCSEVSPSASPDEFRLEPSQTPPPPKPLVAPAEYLAPPAQNRSATPNASNKPTPSGTAANTPAPTSNQSPTESPVPAADVPKLTADQSNGQSRQTRPPSVWRPAQSPPRKR